MSIPEEHLPQIDEPMEDPSEDPSDEVESAGPEMLEEEDELQLESAEAEFTDEDGFDDEEASSRDTASFGFGDPAD